ncbi:hypothetical protein GCM10010435_81090 [Winogradskya consettensis]|uniref:Uncharacterized protein n=1 Tax=Winogradskya consettensis TaxID=113560 RepID=A0A919SRK1_9ACTN|nr:hypothetical protein Aco04nite_53890 [Actinoplanes consettensis]
MGLRRVERLIAREWVRVGSGGLLLGNGSASGGRLVAREWGCVELGGLRFGSGANASEISGCCAASGGSALGVGCPAPVAVAVAVAVTAAVVGLGWAGGW